MQDNEEALMVTYFWREAPGDSYVWLVDENYVQKHGECG
jgi:hypothetical protein